jgi:hypothetical protein
MGPPCCHIVDVVAGSQVDPLDILLFFFFSHAAIIAIYFDTCQPLILLDYTQLQLLLNILQFVKSGGQKRYCYLSLRSYAYFLPAWA